MANDSETGEKASIAAATEAFETGDVEGAVSICRRVLDEYPRDAACLGLLGRIFHAAGQPSSAAGMFQRALALDPNDPETMFRLSAFLEDHGDFDEALKFYRYALTHDPGYAERRRNRSLEYFNAGDLRRGWREYEFRSTLRTPGAFADRFWRGEDLTGKTVLVIGEQGIGDQVMFATCLPDLVARAGHVIIEPDRRLVAPMRRAFPDCTVIGDREFRADGDGRQPEIEGISADHAVMMGSLPRFFRPTLADFPAPASRVLRPDEAVVENMRHGLSERGDAPRIGICWRSLYMTEGRSRKYPPMDAWAPMLSAVPVTFVSLQANLEDSERHLFRDRFGTALVEVPGVDLVDDVDATAALIAGLDGVVSAKTYIAWFAAGTGVPAWRVNTGSRHDDPWLFGGQSPCWFPDLTVLCETDDGGFDGIFRRIASELVARPA